MTDKQRIKQLEERLNAFEKSPLKKAYLSLLLTISRWFDQAEYSNIDITNPEHKLQFEMVHKFFTELTFYIETLDKLRSRMSPEDSKELDGGAVEEMIKMINNGSRKG